MPIAADTQIQVPPPSMARTVLRSGRAQATHGIAFERDGSGEGTRAWNETTRVGVKKQMIETETFDWNKESEHRKFAALERKVGRSEASPEEIGRYQTMLAARRAWIVGSTYLSDYIEEERQKLLLKKLAEIREILNPISI